MFGAPGQKGECVLRHHQLADERHEPVNLGLIDFEHAPAVAPIGFTFAGGRGGCARFGQRVLAAAREVHVRGVEERPRIARLQRVGGGHGEPLRGVRATLRGGDVRERAADRSDPPRQRHRVGRRQGEDAALFLNHPRHQISECAPVPIRAADGPSQAGQPIRAVRGDVDDGDEPAQRRRRAAGPRPANPAASGPARAVRPTGLQRSSPRSVRKTASAAGSSTSRPAGTTSTSGSSSVNRT